MGNNSSSQGNIRSSQLQDWVKMEDQGNCELWSNKKINQLFQAYPIPENMATDQKELEIYEFRKTHKRFLVSVEAVVSPSSGLVCTQSQAAYVLTENIDSRLSQHVQKITFEEGLYVLIQAASGYNTLNSFFGAIDPTAEMICVNDQGQVKVWLNEHLSINSQPGVLRPQTGDYNQARMRTKDCVGQLFRIVESTIRGNYPDDFRREIKDISTYFEASNYVDYYKEIHHIAVPNHLKPLKLGGQDRAEIALAPPASHTSIQPVQSEQARANNLRSSGASHNSGDNRRQQDVPARAVISHPESNPFAKQAANSGGNTFDALRASQESLQRQENIKRGTNNSFQQSPSYGLPPRAPGAAQPVGSGSQLDSHKNRSRESIPSSQWVALNPRQSIEDTPLAFNLQSQDYTNQQQTVNPPPASRFGGSENDLYGTSYIPFDNDPQLMGRKSSQQSINNIPLINRESYQNDPRSTNLNQTNYVLPQNDPYLLGRKSSQYSSSNQPNFASSQKEGNLQTTTYVSPENDPALQAGNKNTSSTRRVPTYFDSQSHHIHRKAPPESLMGTTYVSPENDPALQGNRAEQIREEDSEDEPTPVSSNPPKNMNATDDVEMWNSQLNNLTNSKRMQEGKRQAIQPSSEEEINKISYPSWNKQISIAKNVPSHPQPSLQSRQSWQPTQMFMSYPSWGSKQSFSQEVRVPTGVEETQNQLPSQQQVNEDDDIEEYIRQKYQSYLQEQEPNQTHNRDQYEPRESAKTQSVNRRGSTELYNSVEERYNKYVANPQKPRGVKERAMGLDGNQGQPSGSGEERGQGQLSYQKLRSMLWRG